MWRMNLNNQFELKVVNHAIECGVQYLLSQKVNGRWKGFPTLAGESDIWVTGFVLAHIGDFCKEPGAIKDSQQFLSASRHASGGWSYSAAVPPDADSTAWCIMALQAGNDFNDRDEEKAKGFLWSHSINQGLSTYKVDSGIREFISATSDKMIAGWTSAHPDVSIAAVLSDLQNENVPGLLHWLVNQQTVTGFFDSYWWCTPHYATTLLLRALAMLKLRLPNERASLLAEALVSEQLTDGGYRLQSSIKGDPFTTALALESFAHLSYLGHQPEKTKCGNALLLSQNTNGSWAGDYILRIPAPFVTDPNQVDSWNGAYGGGNSLIKDKDGLFATAMACYALDCWRQSELKRDLSGECHFFQLAPAEIHSERPLIKTNTVNGLA